MNAVILCPGPSLAKFTKSEHLTIGVNRAACGFQCDWWACSDYPVIRDYRAMGRPKLFTNRQTMLDITGKFSHLFESMAAKEELFATFPPLQIPWTLYTATSALVLAAHLGATTIEVWGVDFDGVADWDGHEYGWVGNEAWRTRGGDKWSGQIKNWNLTASALRERGIEIVR